jgi:hypothetical protein
MKKRSMLKIILNLKLMQIYYCKKYFQYYTVTSYKLKDLNFMLFINYVKFYNLLFLCNKFKEI